MPPRDPNKPQLDFPQLIADLIAQLQLQGPIGLLDFNDSVQPTVLVAIRDGVSFTLASPAFTSAGIFSDIAVAPVIGTVFADTGPLPAGTYDVKAGWSMSNDQNSTNFELQHRNAANAANLATWPHQLQGNVIFTQMSFPISFGYELGANERLRFETLNQNASVGSQFNAWIMAQIRPAP